MTDNAPARLVATVGLHGSASTWVFNVVRELMLTAFGDDGVTALFSDDAMGVLADETVAGRHVVVKAHRSGPGLGTLLWLTQAPVLLSVRDPRDALLSVMHRFDVPFEDAVDGLALDCSFVQDCAAAGGQVMRYEDAFFDDETVPATLARRLALPVEDAACRAIFLRYRTEAVRAFAATIPDLPQDRLVVDPGTMLDRQTQIHRTHIGDGAIGKWRHLLDPSQQRVASDRFAPFLERFGYAM